MREHVLPTTRMHYIYESAGVAPNIVPEFAQIWLTLRAADVARGAGRVAWARDVAEGAAQMTQTDRGVRPVYYGCTTSCRTCR
jgi:aminobenzoyl-glutamate utilization protein B